MKRLLILQHEPGDDLRQWRALMRSLGVRADIVDFSRRPDARPKLSGYSGLVLLGGAMDVHEAARRPHLAHEMSLVRQAADRKAPVLGICLGAQLAAKALGGRVFEADRPEIGWFDLELTPAGRRDPFARTLSSGAKAFQWHSYAFSLPKGATLLASSPACRNQAFRLGGRVLAAQFHFEVDKRTISDWLSGSSLARSRKARLLADTRRYMDDSRILGRRLWTSFLETL
ncbi:MAG: type 1 glutamine amidotransferase [Proteobacteria bacterium]|nr:type 1 glutamine amidotransferase [Pseudomonadota bacterium]